MELRRSSHYDGFESNSERDIKSVFHIDYQFIGEKSSQRNFGKLAIKYKLGLRIFLFFTSKTQYLVHCPFCHLCIGLFQKNWEIPKLSPWMFNRIVLDPLEILRPKTDPWNFHVMYSWSPFGNSILLSINPWKFRMLFLCYP